MYARKPVHPLALTTVTLATFFLFFTTLHMVDFVPEMAVEEEKNPEITAVAAETNTPSENPVRIVIDKFGVDSSIETPESRDLAVLDEALTRGVVHYPGSGTLDDNANVFLFGHSSGLPVIHNPAYKVFNRLGELEKGDLIRVQGEAIENVYRVTSVSLVHAEEALVSLEKGEKRLTLSTCNSFGSKQERFVVEAAFVGSYELN